MSQALGALILLLMAATLWVLLSGVLSMARGKQGSEQKAQRLMRWRIALQAVTLLAVIIYMIGFGV